MNRGTVCRDANRAGCGIAEDSFSSNFKRQISTQNRLELSRLLERDTNLWLINVRGNSFRDRIWLGIELNFEKRVGREG